MTMRETDIATSPTLLARLQAPGPFMALSAAGGSRPGVYAGFAGRRQPVLLGMYMSAPFTGLLPGFGSAPSAVGLKPATARRPVNGPLRTTTNGIDVVASPQPGVIAGPTTACGGKGRKRPSLHAPTTAAAGFSSTRFSAYFLIPRAAPGAHRKAAQHLLTISRRGRRG